MIIIQRIKGDGLPKLNRAVDELGNETRMHRAYRLVINKSGGKAFTQVKRALAKQTGMTQRKLIQLGGVRATRANYAKLEFIIGSSGKELNRPLFAGGSNS